MTLNNKAAPAVVVTMVLGILAILGSAAAPQQQYVPPRTASASNQYFEATVSTTGCAAGGCKAFDLTITNKTNKDLEVDWNKTLYVDSGTTSGGFMYEGVVFSARNNPKPPDIVFANSTFRKTIFPNNLVNYMSGRYGGWYHSPIGHGSGVYLTVKVGSEEVHEKLMPQ